MQEEPETEGFPWAPDRGLLADTVKTAKGGWRRGGGRFLADHFRLPRTHLELTKCYLEWLHAENHIEPGEEIRNRAYFHARDSDLPEKPVQNLARFRMNSR